MNVFRSTGATFAVVALSLAAALAVAASPAQAAGDQTATLMVGARSKAPRAPKAPKSPKAKTIRLDPFSGPSLLIV